MTTPRRSLLAVTGLFTAAALLACGGGGGGAGEPPAPAPPPPPAALAPQVTLTITNGGTLAGNVVITLAPETTPVTVANFLAYVNSGFYDNTVFHRHARQANLSTFVLQGGGYTPPLVPTATNPAPKTTRAPIVLERGLSNLRYTVAMARTSVANSATAEFFINTVDNAFLDTSSGGYAAFGTVTAGMALVDSMVAAPCAASALNFGNGSPDCLPVPNLVITRAVQTR
jgi:cyclophilin family peptidyl-prolyl cis-trans isomerase